MAIHTRTITINPAFLQEIKEDNQQLRQLLHELGETFAGSGGVAAHQAVVLLGRCRDQLSIHFSLEEAYGYFEDAVNVAPRLSEKADLLRSEHEPLFQEICSLAEEAESLLRRDATLAALQKIAVRFQAFRERLQDHEARENELIMESLNDDIGVGD